MNEIQTGTPSRQLVPQSFSNSNQTGTLQSGSNLQESSITSDQLNVLSVPGKLTVVSAPSSSVLGSSTVASSQNASITTSSYNAIPAASFVLIVGVLCIAIYLGIRNKYEMSNVETEEAINVVDPTE